jgi:hypothetical protein
MRAGATVVQGGGARVRHTSIVWNPDSSDVYVSCRIQMSTKQKGLYRAGMAWCSWLLYLIDISRTWCSCSLVSPRN